jgi:hypothetical protein
MGHNTVLAINHNCSMLIDFLGRPTRQSQQWKWASLNTARAVLWTEGRGSQSSPVQKE